MIGDWHQLLSLDLPPMVTATAAACACALLGNFLVLRRLSLMGDAISHAVLPGIVVAFLISGSRSTLPVFIGAACAGVLTTILVELLRKVGRLEPGAAMGVSFSILFASGVLLIEQAAARNIDLDADCLLHGQLETIFWYPPKELAKLFSLQTLYAVPAEVTTSLVVFAVSLLFVLTFYKELKLTSFDSGLAAALGFRPNVMHYVLMIILAAAVVASFEAVGSILVIAMLICPPATARLLTDKLHVQLVLSVVLAAITGIGGYLLGAFGPLLLGFDNSVNAAGMMSVLSGVLLGAAIVLAPQYGLIARWIRRARFALHTRQEDLLGLLFRHDESGASPLLTREDIFTKFGDSLTTRYALRSNLRGGLISEDNGLQLTVDGSQKGSELIRHHRLWESYLVDKLHLRSDHVHPKAERLEHYQSEPISEVLESKTESATTDPHGKPIPPNKSK